MSQYHCIQYGSGSGYSLSFLDSLLFTNAVMLYIKVLIVVTVSNLLTSFSDTSFSDTNFLLDRISKTSGDWATVLVSRKNEE